MFCSTLVRSSGRDRLECNVKVTLWQWAVQVVASDDLSVIPSVHLCVNADLLRLLT